MLTRDQLRAARVLLHLRQDQLAEIAMVGVATIRRFEGGQEIGPLHLDALRRAIEDAGAILISGGVSGGLPREGRREGVGVVLRIEADLPEETRKRLLGEADEGKGSRDAGRSARGAGPGPDAGSKRTKGRRLA